MTTESASAPTTLALVVAAGRGERAGGGLPKQYRRIGGRTVLARSIEAMAVSPAIKCVRVAISPADRALHDAVADELSVNARQRMGEPLIGGASRQETVRLALETLAGSPPDRVMVHDAARCFVDPDTIARVVGALDHHDAVVPAIAVTDTIKVVDEAGCVAATPARALLRAVQTPQGFAFGALLAAHRAAAGRADLTDDAAVMEAAGHRVIVVAGSDNNTKLTTSEDFSAAERRLVGNVPSVRVGQGYDVHAFGPGDHVWLGGVRIPHDRGLVAHSDGDVALHALTDAVLGAIGAGDIGTHFPPSEARWRGASSDRFLAHAARLVASKGGRIVNVDVTIVCEAPKVGPHRAAMAQAIALAAGIAADRVSIKATTSEKMGFTGRGEGLAALALATVVLPEP